MLLLAPLRSMVLRWVNQSPSRQLLAESAWVHKYQLLAVFLLGSAGAILEGLTFALLAVSLELLATNGSLTVERLAPWGLSWLAIWSTGRQFIVLVLSAVACQVLKSILQVLNTQMSTYLSTQAALQVQNKVLRAILSMKFSSASRYKIGELTNMVVTSADSLAQTLIQSLAWLTNFLTVFAYVAVLCSISFPLFLAAILLFSSVLLLQKTVGKKIGFLSHQLGMQQGDLSRKMVEGVSALRLVHAFQRQEFFRDQVEKMQKVFIDTMQRLNGRMAMLGPMSDSLLLLGLGVFLLVGFFLFKENRANLLPDLLTFIAVLNRLSGRVSQIGVGWSYIKMFSGRVGIVDGLLEASARESSPLGGKSFDKICHGITFQTVELEYEGREEKALRGVSVEWPIGTSLALVGPSGSGKSSMADLLLGLYEPTAGKIIVDGTCLTEIDKTAWRSMVGVVSQDTILFNASIEENLRFALPDASEEELVSALKGADAWEFVSQLPQGIKTLVGERGFMLSGGQRQRIAIARALLRRPQLLILDEATSALDSQAEQSVQKTIDALGQGTTRLIIAHRLSTIINADQICVLDKGLVVESGTHNELLAKNGIYASLWRKQTGDDSNHSFSFNGQICA
jgi:ATP-binding cassette subfamily B protein/subfamily B ATP-binding cassette protein MsbA